MSLKGTSTRSDYLNFDEVTIKALKIIRQGKESNLGFLTIVGINIGLRISDLLSLTYQDLENESLILIEGKTGKKRTIRINNNIREALSLLKKVTGKSQGLLFVSRNNGLYSVQYINRWLKSTYGTNGPKKNKLKISTHSLRKTFARRAYESANNKESALVFLSEIFNHSSLAITKKYLGIRQEELDDVYLSL
jgi:integrase